MEREDRQLLIVAAVGRNLPTFAIEDKPVRTVPVFDDVQSLVNLTAKCLGMEILAQEDRFHRLAEFTQRLVGGMLRSGLAEPAQDRFRVGGTQAEGCRILDDLIILLANDVPINAPQREDRLEMGVLLGVAHKWPVQLLVGDALQPGEQLKPQDMTKGKGDFRLPMRIDELSVNFHFRTVSEHTLNHGGHFGRRAAFHLRIVGQC